MIQVVVMNGFPESGKTTFEDKCIELLGAYASKISTIDGVKHIATLCGWDGTKTPENRKFLSDLKDLLSSWTDYPFKNIMAHCKSKQFEFDQLFLEDAIGYCFVDSREIPEIKRFKQEMGAVTVLIRRPGDDSHEQSNHADQGVLDYDYDFTIWNDGSIEDLNKKAEQFVDTLEADTTVKYLKKKESNYDN